MTPKRSFGRATPAPPAGSSSRSIQPNFSTSSAASRPDRTKRPPMDNMDAIRETFFQECEEQLDELERGLLAMQEGSSDAETVNAVFRAVHSIKGGAGAFKLDALVRFAHSFETTLEMIRNGLLAPSPAVMRTMLRAADVLSDLVTEARGGGGVDPARSAEIIAELTGHTGGGARSPLRIM